MSDRSLTKVAEIAGIASAIIALITLYFTVYPIADKMESQTSSADTAHQTSTIKPTLLPSPNEKTNQAGKTEQASLPKQNSKAVKDLNFYLHYPFALALVEDSTNLILTKGINYNVEKSFWGWLENFFLFFCFYMTEFSIILFLYIMICDWFDYDDTTFISAALLILLAVRSILFIANGLFIFGGLFLAIAIFGLWVLYDKN